MPLPLNTTSGSKRANLCRLSWAVNKVHRYHLSITAPVLRLQSRGCCYILSVGSRAIGESRAASPLAAGRARSQISLCQIWTRPRNGQDRSLQSILLCAINNKIIRRAGCPHPAAKKPCLLRQMPQIICRGRCLHRPAEIYGIASCKICGIPGLSIGRGHPATPKLRRITHCKSCAELFPTCRGRRPRRPGRA